MAVLEQVFRIKHRALQTGTRKSLQIYIQLEMDDWNAFAFIGNYYIYSSVYFSYHFFKTHLSFLVLLNPNIPTLILSNFLKQNV